MYEKLFALATYCMLMAATPGPNTVMLTASGANFGYRRSFPHILGVVIGLTLLTLLACFGLGAVFQRFPQLHDVLRVVGSVYMVYLAWRIARASAAEEGATRKPLTFTEAALFQLVNPKSWVRSVTLATVFMPSELSVAIGAFLVSGIGMVIGFCFMTVWTLFGVGIRTQLRSPSHRRAFNAVMGAALFLLAISLMLPRS